MSITEILPLARQILNRTLLDSSMNIEEITPSYKYNFVYRLIVLKLRMEPEKQNLIGILPDYLNHQLHTDLTNYDEYY